MTNLDKQNIQYKLDFLRNLTKSSLGHFACLRHMDDTYEEEVVARVVVCKPARYTSSGLVPRKFKCFSKNGFYFNDKTDSGVILTQKEIEHAILKKPMVRA